MPTHLRELIEHQWGPFWRPLRLKINRLPIPAAGSRKFENSQDFESGRPDSNRRRPAWEACPTSADRVGARQLRPATVTLR